jgi:type IV pilus assembly protein PilB
MDAVRASRKLGDILVDNGAITLEQLGEALRVQKQSGERLDKVLINLGFVTEQDILDVLGFQPGISKITMPGKIDQKLLESVPEFLIRRHRIIPVKKEGNRLVVATMDPLNAVAFDDLQLVTGLNIVPIIATEKEIEALINKYFGRPELQNTLQELERLPEYINTETVRLKQPDDVTGEAPIVKLVNSIIVQAINEKASDVHIEPWEDGLRVRYRVDGFLREIMNLPGQIRHQLISRLKILSNMDIAEKRKPQDGRIQIKYHNCEVDLRVSTMPNIFGEKIVIRLLDKSANLYKINQLGFQEENFQMYSNLLKYSCGMILITGPTGSGKTTTLFATLSELNTRDKNIVTIEEPVEYVLKGINQTQVNPKAGLTFALGLRSILRQDPDVIMLGEIRDAETAEIAVRAATTGHMVFSTLHTNDAAGALTRLADMGVEPFLVASSVLGVTAQRLVRLICPRCKESYELPGDAPERSFMGVGPDEPVVLYRGTGCPHCGQTGYRGRTGIHEVLPVSRKIKELVTRKSSSDEIREQAVREGMVTLKEDGLKKALEGLTTLQEVMRVAYAD